MSYLIRSTSLLALLFLLAGCAGAQQTITESPSPPVVPAPPAAAADPVLPDPALVPSDFERAIARDTRTWAGLPGEDYWQQESDYTLEARLFPEEKRLEGSGRIRYINHSPDTLQILRLELIQNLHAEGAPRLEAAEVTGGLRLQRVALDREELPAQGRGRGRYLVEGTQLIVIPRQPLLPGASVELELDWAFTIPQRGGSGSDSGRMGYAEDLFFLAYWYPIMSVYDDVEGWHDDAFLGRAEFYAGFSDYDVTLEVPAGWVVQATGRLQNEEEVFPSDVLARMRRAHASDEPLVVLTPDDFGTETAPGGRLRWHFRAEDVRDFAFSATREGYWMAARTPVGDRDGDGALEYTHINAFYREPAVLWADVAAYMQHAVTFLSEFNGLPYPWPHMTAVEGADIIGGGMEFPMMTLMGDYNARGARALYNVTAHELAHMWVPMIVASNERRFSWIDEGSATFAENAARMDYFPGENHFLQDQMNYLNIAQRGIEGPIMRRSNFHYSDLAFYSASYFKPGSLLQALRGVLGEETFLRAYRTFIDAWAFKHPYPYDLFNTFEHVSGRDLDWFWRTWFYETWTLDQAIAGVNTQGETTEIVIENEGRAPMPVLLEITLADGEAIRRELPVDVWLEGDTRATVEVEADAPVRRVEIDPAFYFPDIDRSDNVWVRP